MKRNAYQKAYRKTNRKKLLAQMRAWREANRERHRAQSRIWYEVNRERALAKRKAWREANRQKVAAKNKIWRKANRDKRNAAEAKRHSKKLQAIPKWSTKEDQRRIEGVYLAAKELAPLAGCKLEVDHIIPLQGREVCGLHVFWNLQLLTREENISKGNRLNVNY